MGGSYQNIEPGVPRAAQDVWGQFQKAGQDLAQNYGGYKPYGGVGAPGMSTQQQLGLQGIQNWAMQPGALEQGGQNLLANTLGGKYLNNNPFLKQQSQAMAENMGEAINQQSQQLGDLFSKMGVSYRGPAEKQMRAKALSDFGNTMTNLYGQNYQNERANQMNALGQAGAWSQMPGNRMQTLMNAGAIPQQIAQNQATFGYNDWIRQLQAQQMPYNIYGNMMTQMPLMYPQQQYNPGFLDYASQMLPAFLKMYGGMGAKGGAA